MASAPVVILGAGFAGCATAWALARRGIAAVVLEREPELGRSASGRGAGLGRQLCEDDTTSALAIRGAALLRTELAAAWSPTGGILCFEDATHANEYVARAARLGVAHEVLDRARVLRRWPQLTQLPIASALHVPSDGVIDAGTLLAALSAGIQIELGAAATHIEPHGRGVRIEVTRATREVPAVAPRADASRADSPRTDSPRAESPRADSSRAESPRADSSRIDIIQARVVVDATGAWAGALTGDAPLESFKRHLFVVEATAASDSPYVWHLGANELYLRRAGAQLLVSPCDGDPTPPIDQQPSPDADARLRGRLVDAAPGLVGAPIARRWACQRAFAPDRLMRLGRDPRRPWLVWAAALGGHGATASPAVGEVVADAVVEVLRG